MSLSNEDIAKMCDTTIARLQQRQAELKQGQKRLADDLFEVLQLRRKALDGKVRIC